MDVAFMDFSMRMRHILPLSYNRLYIMSSTFGIIKTRLALLAHAEMYEKMMLVVKFVVSRMRLFKSYIYFIFCPLRNI